MSPATPPGEAPLTIETLPPAPAPVFVPPCMMTLPALAAPLFAPPTSETAPAGTAGAPVPAGFRSVEDYLLREKDSLSVYRNRAKEVLNHILVEIPEIVMPMRKEYKVDYGITLLELVDEASAKKVLDMAVKDCVQYGTYFVKWEEQMFGAREVQMSRDILKSVVDECDRLGKKDWAAEYREQAAKVN